VVAASRGAGLPTVGRASVGITDRRAVLRARARAAAAALAVASVAWRLLRFGSMAGRRGNRLREAFRHFAHDIAVVVGSPWAFCTALTICLVWAFTGPLFGYSDTWQLAINTGTTIVTFLMVFLIQNTQNRDALAIHLKLDELLRAIAKARTGFADIEDLSDEEIEALQREFKGASLRNRVAAGGVVRRPRDARAPRGRRRGRGVQSTAPRTVAGSSPRRARRKSR
jgi:low affinity Fe/Cu permease